SISAAQSPTTLESKLEALQCHFTWDLDLSSQAYLSKVNALMEQYPSPSQDELHPEIYAEKAWTLMKFSTDKKLLAADYFQRAIRMKPDMVEWNTSRVLALANAANYRKDEALGA
ncbi:hypothetical protein GBF38_000818, partial [Nibea albiflora]